VNALDLISELAEEAKNLPEVLAPVISGHGVVAVIDRHPYKFRLNASNTGWFVLRPINSRAAEISREAHPHEIMEYLKALPRLQCISCRRLATESWLVYPFNVGDANQRFSMEFPRPTHLVNENIEPFQAITCRVMGVHLLYDRISSAWSSDASFQERLGKEISSEDVKFPFPELRTVYEILLADVRERKKKTKEGRIEDAITYLGAELISFTERGEDYVVRWKDGGATRQATVSKELRLLSAGICLNDREREQTLTSTVAVLREYERGYEDEDDYKD